MQTVPIRCRICDRPISRKIRPTRDPYRRRPRRLRLSRRMFVCAELLAAARVLLDRRGLFAQPRILPVNQSSRTPLQAAATARHVSRDALDSARVTRTHNCTLRHNIILYI